MKEYQKIVDDWQFNILNIYNFNKNGSLDKYFEFIKKNHKKIKGDLIEAGVFTGKSLLATAIYLKKIGSRKKIYAFDTWEGFPKEYKQHPKDKHRSWQKLYNEKLISKQQYKKVKLNLRYIKFIKNKKIDSFNISTSNNFSNCSIYELKRKISFLELDNIILRKGSFKKTMNKNFKLENIFSALLDVDLYESYKTALPFLWDKLSKKGIIFLDEYYSIKFPGARLACNEFFLKKKIKPVCVSRKNKDFERWIIKK